VLRLHDDTEAPFAFEDVTDVMAHRDRLRELSSIAKTRSSTSKLVRARILGCPRLLTVSALRE